MASSCSSQASAIPLPPPWSKRTCASASVVDSRAQSRCHSLITAIQVMGTTPACSMRRTAMSCVSALPPPLASVTTKTSYPSPSAWMAGMATQISVHSPAMISFLRPVRSTTSTTRRSSQVLMNVRLIGFWSGKTSWRPLMR